MDTAASREREEALKAIHSMIDRSEQAQQKFLQGTSQHTLQKNRIKALKIAAWFVAQEPGAQSGEDGFSHEEIEAAFTPVLSLISKSEKAQTKVAPTTWQYAMLERNIKALYTGLQLMKG